MYICLECHGFFNNPKTYYGDLLEYWGTPCRENKLGCPLCEGNYIIAFRCSICDEYIDSKYIITEDGNAICNNCYLEHTIGE